MRTQYSQKCRASATTCLASKSRLPITLRKKYELQSFFANKFSLRSKLLPKWDELHTRNEVSHKRMRPHEEKPHFDSNRWKITESWNTTFLNLWLLNFLFIDLLFLNLLFPNFSFLSLLQLANLLNSHKHTISSVLWTALLRNLWFYYHRLHPCHFNSFFSILCYRRRKSKKCVSLLHRYLFFYALLRYQNNSCGHFSRPKQHNSVGWKLNEVSMSSGTCWDLPS